jgi:hypothetical protein
VSKEKVRRSNDGRKRREVKRRKKPGTIAVWKGLDSEGAEGITDSRSASKSLGDFSHEMKHQMPRGALSGSSDWCINFYRSGLLGIIIAKQQETTKTVREIERHVFEMAQNHLARLNRLWLNRNFGPKSSVKHTISDYFRFLFAKYRI